MVTFSDQLHLNKPRQAPPIHYVDNPNEAAEMEYVTKLRLTREVRPGAHTIRDYDFRAPAFELLCESPKKAPEGKYEQYHYLPGGTLVEGGSGARARRDHRLPQP